MPGEAGWERHGGPAESRKARVWPRIPPGMRPRVGQHLHDRATRGHVPLLQMCAYSDAGVRKRAALD